MAKYSEGNRDLSEALKESTKDVHEQAENTQFMKSFQKGQVSLQEFKLYLGSLYYIYCALEEESKRNKDNPVYEPVYFPHELNRKAALEKDLEYFYGPTWRNKIQCHEATQKYVDRLHHVGQYEPELLVAHAYTRYLGDLSGGQILKKIAQKSLHLPNTGEGLAFFNFPGVTNISKFKQLYRARVNSIPIDSATEEKILKEARNAFLLNVEVFKELQRLTSQEQPLEINNLMQPSSDVYKEIQKFAHQVQLLENNNLIQTRSHLHTRGNNQTHSSVSTQEDVPTQTRHSNMLPSTLILWGLALLFLAAIIAVGMHAKRTD